MTADHEEAKEKSFARRVSIAYGLCAFLLLGVGGWAATSTLSGAVLATGAIVVETNSKKVQHATGGIVGAILVRNGELVRAGDVLLRLDDTQTRANLGIVKSQLTELIGRKARLAAERDGSTDIQFPEGFEAGEAESQRVAEGERRLYAAKRKSVQGQKAQLSERIGQLKHEISGLTRQETAKARELELVRDELKRVEEMREKRLTPITRLLAMQREVTRVDGEHGSIRSQIARANGQITETELKILEIEETLRAEAQKEFREIEARIAELNERRVSAQDLLQRVDLRAPETGIVHEFTVHTVGGVISPGETVMSIVPIDDEKAVEVRLAPNDIDQVKIGQHARLRFPAFNQTTTPELAGSIARVAPDLTKDPQSGAAFYVARIKITEQDLAAFKKLKLVAGMPVESYIQTGERTALSYLTKPFTDQLQRAFREE